MRVATAQRWLVWSNLSFALFGVAVAFLGDTIVFELWNRGAADAFFAGSMPPEFGEFKRFLFGIIGGTIAGFHLLLAAVAGWPFGRKEPWAFWAIASSVAAWFVIDSAVGVLTGAWFNVLLINCFALVVLGVPLVLSRHHFTGPTAERA